MRPEQCSIEGAVGIHVLCWGARRLGDSFGHAGAVEDANRVWTVREPARGPLVFTTWTVVDRGNVKEEKTLIFLL